MSPSCFAHGAAIGPVCGAFPRRLVVPKSSYLPKVQPPLLSEPKPRLDARMERKMTSKQINLCQVDASTNLQVPHRPCIHADCASISDAALENKHLCRKHFIEACYARLDEIDELVRQRKLCESVSESLRHFLTECTREVTSEALCAPQLDNLERSRLLHILLLAADLTCRLRRSERVPSLVPVRLINDPEKETWIEDTVTQNLSKHGAMLRCTHPYASGETLALVRLDTGDRAIVRVVWRKQDKFAQHKVAVEILNYSNFWHGRAEMGAHHEAPNGV